MGQRLTRDRPLPFPRGAAERGFFAAVILSTLLSAAWAAEVEAEHGIVVSAHRLASEVGVHILEAGQLNAYDVLVSDDVVFTKDAFDRFTGAGAAETEGSAA